MNRAYQQINSVGQLIMRVADLRCPYCGEDVYWKATPILILPLPQRLDIGFCNLHCLRDYLDAYLPNTWSM